MSISCFVLQKRLTSYFFMQKILFSYSFILLTRTRKLTKILCGMEHEDELQDKEDDSISSENRTEKSRNLPGCIANILSDSFSARLTKQTEKYGGNQKNYQGSRKPVNN